MSDITVPEAIERIAELRARIDAAKAEEAALREHVGTLLVEQWMATGALPTLRTPAGSAWLVGGGPAARVVANDRYGPWAAEHWPDFASLVATIPAARVDDDDVQRIIPTLRMVADDIRTVVDSCLVDHLAKVGRMDGGVLLAPDGSGEMVPVPGVVVATSEPSVRVRPSKDKEQQS